MVDASEITKTTVHSGCLEVPEVHVLAKKDNDTPATQRLEVTPLLVGSGEDAGLRLVDPLVSRAHLELCLDSKGIFVRDLGSKNGVWLNGHRIERAHLAPSATLSVGSFLLSFTAGQQMDRVELHRAASFGGALGSSPSMRALFAKLSRVAPTDTPVLLLGESGTGKEVLARAIHQASQRRESPFLVLDCGGLSSNLVEAELFGHTKGAFTGASSERAGIFEDAEDGTVFIDEVGELKPELQVKLLRVLESKTVRRIGETRERPVRARVISATHQPLSRWVKEGLFRADLFYRLGVVSLPIPPLRQRRDEIPLLVERFLKEQSPPRDLSALPPNAMALLSGYEWPGNVRELRNVVQRLVLFPEDSLPAALMSEEGTLAEGASADETRLYTLPLKSAREILVSEFERRMIRAALARSGANVSQTAEALGVSRQFLHKLLRDYGMSRDGS